MLVQLYTYIAYVTDVYDGDSLSVNIDLGFGVVLTNRKIRLANINAPEIRGEDREAGIVARDVLRELVLNKRVVIKTYKDKTGKYGRYLADVFTKDIHINSYMVENGFAEEYKS